MGTNYYWKKEERPPCSCCNRPYEQEVIHIGKSSMGWCFSLHVTDEITCLADWESAWKEEGTYIEDEYGVKHTPEQMLERITNRRGRDERNLGEGEVPFGYHSWSQFFTQNHAEMGPNNLLRHVIDPEGRHCIGHGNGTWDLIVGDFS